MEGKYTPGPYEITNNGRIPIRIFTCEHSEWIDKETTVAQIGNGRGAPGDFATNLANARLFAAAPDMLAALKRIVAEAEDSGNEGIALDEVRLLIQKAEGAK